MKQKEKQQIAKFFSLSDGELDTILNNITRCRNKCAHGEILYTFRSSSEIQENRIHKALAIPKNNNKLVYGNKDLFSIIIVMKLLLNKCEFDKMMSELNLIIETLAKELKAISINDVLMGMGFIGDWNKISNI